MNIAEDISKLTTIPVTSVQSIIDHMISCTCYELQQQLNNKETNIDIDIGIGTLCLGITEENILYKFIPSTKLEEDIRYTIEHNCCPLVMKLEDSVRDKIFDAYKEFF